MSITLNIALNTMADTYTIYHYEKGRRKNDTPFSEM